MSASDGSGEPSFLKGRGRFARGRFARSIFFLCAFLSVVTTVAIVIVLVVDAADFFSHVSFVEFFTSTRWSPTIKPEEFGVLPLVSGTLTVTLGSALIAIPTGTLTAVYLSEYADERVREVVKPALEVLAGVPTVVYGYFALVYITPFLGNFLPGISTFNALSASVIVGIMVIPMVSSISEDAMSAVPDSLREAGYGLGATKFDVSTSIVIPSALSGIISSYILALSRAIGETMAVTIAGGKLARMVNPAKPGEMWLEPIETMTAAMVEIGLSDVSGTSVEYKSLFAIGLTLFVITFLMNVLSQYVKSRYREVYE